MTSVEDRAAEVANPCPPWCYRQDCGVDFDGAPMGHQSAPTIVRGWIDDVRCDVTLWLDQDRWPDGWRTRLTLATPPPMIPRSTDPQVAYGEMVDLDAQQIDRLVAALLALRPMVDSGGVMGERVDG